jgi:hypothetical protein
MSYQVGGPEETRLYLPPSHAQLMAVPAVAIQAATNYMPEETYNGMTLGWGVGPWYAGGDWAAEGHHRLGEL